MNSCSGTEVCPNNTQKTKAMRLGGEQIHVSVGREQLEQVSDFTYLGFKITDSVDCKKEIRSRLGLGWSALSSLDSMWKSKDVTVSTKKRLMQALI